MPAARLKKRRSRSRVGWFGHIGCGWAGGLYVAGLVGIDGGGGVDFGGDARREPNDRIGLVFVLGVIAGKVLVDVTVNLDIFCRMHVGYVPGPAKSLHTISSNSISIDSSTLSS